MDSASTLPVSYSNLVYRMPRCYSDHSDHKSDGGTVSRAAGGGPSSSWVGWWRPNGGEWAEVCQRHEWADCEGCTLAVASSGRISVLPPGVHPLDIPENRVVDAVSRGRVERIKQASGHIRPVLALGDDPVPVDVQERGRGAEAWRYNRGSRGSRSHAVP